MKYTIILMTLLFSSVASAEMIYCTGKVENVYIADNGDINLKGKWRGSWTKICNTNDPDTIKCSLWASYVASAVQNNLDVTIRYAVNDGVTCQTLPTYSDAPAPKYIMVHNPVQ